MPPNRTLAAVAVLGVAAYALAACTTRARPEADRPSLRATIVLETPSPQPTRIITAPPTTPRPAPSRTRLDACHPSGKPIAVREPSAATTARVSRAWRRIEAWLRAHAPRSARTLRKPAPDAAIARLQARLGHALPPDLVAGLRRHDGADDRSTAAFTLPPFHVPMSATAIHRDWHMMCGVVEDTGLAGPGDWQPRFTPFAQANDGGELYADRNGQVGEYFAENGADTKGYPGSYAAFLETTAELLETGRPGPSGFRARVRDGVLDWRP